MTTTLAIMIGIAIAIIIFFLRRYRPWVDVTREGDVLLWYNYHYYNYPNDKWFVSRQCKFLFKIKR
jgi:hypothetical protein